MSGASLPAMSAAPHSPVLEHPIQATPKADEIQPAPLLPHRLAAMEREIDGSPSSSASSGGTRLLSPTIDTSDDGHEKEAEVKEQIKQLQIMLTALKTPATARGSLNMMSPNTMRARQRKLDAEEAAAAAAQDTADTDEQARRRADSDDDGATPVHLRKPPPTEGDANGKGAANKASSPGAAPVQHASVDEQSRIIHEVLDSLNQGSTRAYAFGPAEQAVLSESIRDAAAEAENAAPGDRDIRVQKAADVASQPVSTGEIDAYLTTAPLLYADSAPISPPHPNAPIFAKSAQAQRVYQQCVQALYMHNAMADFAQSAAPQSDDAKHKAATRAAERLKRAEARKADGDAESESDEESSPTVLSSLTLSAHAVHSKDKSAPVPKSPCDPTHPALRPLLLALEAAFDAPDRTTQAHAAPFRSSVRCNLALTQSLMRLHQSRLDAHPTHTLPAFSSAKLFNTFYLAENQELNLQLSRLEEMMQFEQSHRRPEEDDSARGGARRGSETNTSSSAASAAKPEKPKKKKKSFWACCTSVQEEPEIEPEARMQPKPSAASAYAASSSSFSASASAAVDCSPITAWSAEDFSSNWDLLLKILLQHETTLDAELDAEELRAAQAKAKIVRPSDIAVHELQHPDEVEEAKQREAEKRGGEEKDDASEEKHASIYTSRTLNASRMRPLSATSLRLLQIYADLYRVGKPHGTTRTLSLLSTNLNYNREEFYQCCLSQLVAAHQLFRSHSTLAAGAKLHSGGAQQQKKQPFTTQELATFKAVVRDLWEWVCLSLQRYHLVFARTQEDALLGRGGPDDDAQDGLRECLKLFLTLAQLLKDLDIPAHVHPDQAARAVSSPASAHPIDLLKRLVEQAIAARYHSIVAGIVKDGSDVPKAGAAAALSPVPATVSPSDVGSESNLTHVSQLSRLIKAVTAEVLLDMQRSRVFSEVCKDERVAVEEPASPIRPPNLTDAAAMPANARGATSSAGPSSSRHSRAPSATELNDPSIHRGGFNLAQVSSATLLTYLWRDTQQFLSQQRVRYAELAALPHRTNAQAAEVTSIESQLDAMVRLHTRLADLYSLVSRNVPNLPDLRERVAGWFRWAISAWIARVNAQYGGGPPVAAGSETPACKTNALLAADAFLINLGHSSIRYSSSFIKLFAFLHPLAHTFLASPYSQRNVEEFARLLSSVIGNYVRVLHSNVSSTLEKERKKGVMWGSSIVAAAPSSPRGAPPEVELSLPPSLFVRLNNMLLTKTQLQLLLDELNLPAAWSGTLPYAPARDACGPHAIERSPSVIKNSSTPAAQLGGEIPTSGAAAITSHNPAASPSPSPVSPSSSASSYPPLPAAVQDTLECRPAVDVCERSLDDLLLRMTAGLGVFVEQQISSVIWRQSEEEWTGRHTREEIEPLLAYLQRHLDHMRAYMYDASFSRLLFFIVSDLVLILEKELVHPKKQHYKHRLRTEQVHRVIQIHYMLTDFFESDYKLPAEYLARLKSSHLLRLEYLETLMTGESSKLVQEFDAIDEAHDDAQQALPFTERESLRLQRPPYLSRRQIAGILKFRADVEGDHSVAGFIKQHKQSMFSISANYFQ